MEVVETKCTEGSEILREGQGPSPPVWESLQGRCKLSAGSGTELRLSEDFFCILFRLVQILTIIQNVLQAPHSPLPNMSR